jgi:choline dehydrogenase-like flavoprotein
MSKADPNKNYDVLIVGAGIAGSILARKLAEAGKSVLILEAGRNTAISPEGYQSFLENYYLAGAKAPDSPYPLNPNAAQMDGRTLAPIPQNGPLLTGYEVQLGPLPFGSDYVRAKGGTTLHWLGTCLRMLPNDFRLQTTYGQGADWPISYEELRPYYEVAEKEIGVSGEVADQKVPGVGSNFYSPGYVYPMQKLPQSYADMMLIKAVKGLPVSLYKGGPTYELDIITTPQGRNSIPNSKYDGGRGYEPVGSTGDPLQGLRCEGNASCVPICPVQAKYNAMKSLQAAIGTGRVDVVTQAVVSKLNIDAASGRITGVAYTSYNDESNVFGASTATATAKIYVLAGNAIENPKMLLASGACKNSPQLGRNLMDHPTLLTWGLMPENIGAFRGPGSTSNIPTFRDGDFRSENSAFIVPLDNWGWTWGAFSPYPDVAELSATMFGERLKLALNERLSRQFCLQYEFEQLPDPANCASIDAEYRDQLGNFRPVIRYNVTDYTRLAMERATYVNDAIFAKAGIKSYTAYVKSDPGSVEFRGKGYTYRGAGHLVGTHRMGFSREQSVVDRRQRTWDHDNLFLVGCGNMASIGTSNPTLTLSALTCWAAENILQDLKQSKPEAGSPRRKAAASAR